MTDAKRDNNQVPVMLGISSVDGVTPKPASVIASTHRVQVENGSGGSDLSGDDAKRDNNQVPVMMAVSSADGVTPVPVYINPANLKILVKST